MVSSSEMKLKLTTLFILGGICVLPCHSLSIWNRNDYNIDPIDWNDFDLGIYMFNYINTKETNWNRDTTIIYEF